MQAIVDLFRVTRLLLEMCRGIQHSRRVIVIVIVAGIVSGVCNTALIALINTAINSDGQPAARLGWWFVGLCLVIAATRFVSGALLVRLMQRAVYDLRMSLSRQIIAAPLRLLEHLGAHKLLVTLVNDVPRISDAIIALPLLFMNIAIVVGCLVYLGVLSWGLLLGVIFFMILGILTHQLPVMKATQHFGRARDAMDTLIKHLRALLNGVKELKLHRRRRETFLTKLLEPTALSMHRENVVGETIWAAAGSWGQILFFVAIGLVIFAAPRLSALGGETLTGYTLTILFMTGPLDFVLNTLPRLTQADVAMKKIEALSVSLAGHTMSNEATAQTDAKPEWRLLEIDNVTHSYDRDGQEDFTLGPINLSFRPGEIVFIAGGNGSGKTTLAKLLTGLYVPESGEIRIDGEPVTNENRDYYRQFFSVVYSDFFLFEELLGLAQQDLDAKAQQYLVQLQLDHKVTVTGGTLSTLDLSQGQRKRLALLTAYLEDRHIYVFDEWAADQDPQFRELFYLQLLPGLKARGKTVLVISHDDRYYYLADRMIKLDYGRQESDERVASAEEGAPQYLAR
ncbi:MAG TPA: cyclic peptide export ABC transporter [Pyrinomonadaceae bacterium]